MPVYKANSEFARIRDEIKAERDAEHQKALRDAVDREPDRFVSPERFFELAAELDLDDE
ncbi:MAG TPA: hypothetical protein VHA75_20260 [Rugosimonospora sp.]|nr:hypothetical protein [Rugosimonospora sp.]